MAHPITRGLNLTFILTYGFLSILIVLHPWGQERGNVLVVCTTVDTLEGKIFVKGDNGEGGMWVVPGDIPDTAESIQETYIEEGGRFKLMEDENSRPSSQDDDAPDTSSIIDDGSHPDHIGVAGNPRRTYSDTKRERRMSTLSTSSDASTSSTNTFSSSLSALLNLGQSITDAVKKGTRAEKSKSNDLPIGRLNLRLTVRPTPAFAVAETFMAPIYHVDPAYKLEPNVYAVDYDGIGDLAVIKICLAFVPVNVEDGESKNLNLEDFPVCKKDRACVKIPISELALMPKIIHVFDGSQADDDWDEPEVLEDECKEPAVVQDQDETLGDQTVVQEEVAQVEKGQNECGVKNNKFCGVLLTIRSKIGKGEVLILTPNPSSSLDLTIVSEKFSSDPTKIMVALETRWTLKNYFPQYNYAYQSVTWAPVTIDPKDIGMSKDDLGDIFIWTSSWFKGGGVLKGLASSSDEWINGQVVTVSQMVDKQPGDYTFQVRKGRHLHELIRRRKIDIMVHIVVKDKPISMDQGQHYDYDYKKQSFVRIMEAFALTLSGMGYNFQLTLPALNAPDEETTFDFETFEELKNKIMAFLDSQKAPVNTDESTKSTTKVQASLPQTPPKSRSKFSSRLTMDSIKSSMKTLTTAGLSITNKFIAPQERSYEIHDNFKEMEDHIARRKKKAKESPGKYGPYELKFVLTDNLDEIAPAASDDENPSKSTTYIGIGIPGTDVAACGTHKGRDRNIAFSDIEEIVEIDKEQFPAMGEDEDPEKYHARIRNVFVTAALGPIFLDVNDFIEKRRREKRGRKDKDRSIPSETVGSMAQGRETTAVDSPPVRTADEDAEGRSDFFEY